jgi:hypothetical protein
MNKQSQIKGYVFLPEDFRNSSKVDFNYGTYPADVGITLSVGDRYHMPKPRATLLELFRKGRSNDILLEVSYNPKEQAISERYTCTVLWQANAKELVHKLGLWHAKEIVKDYQAQDFAIPVEVSTAIEEKQTWIEKGGTSNKTQSPPNLAGEIVSRLENIYAEKPPKERATPELIFQIKSLAMIYEALELPGFGFIALGKRADSSISDEKLSAKLDELLKELKGKTLEHEISL